MQPGDQLAGLHPLTRLSQASLQGAGEGGEYLYPRYRSEEGADLDGLAHTEARTTDRLEDSRSRADHDPLRDIKLLSLVAECV